jgi:single-strand DNA-binding protein
MNKVVLIGRLTRDVELKFTQGGGTAVASFTLAVDRQFKNKETGKYEADFINCVVWGKLAETMSNYLKKGSLIATSGRIQTRSYEGNDGQKKYVTEVVVEDFQFLERKEGGSKPQAPAQDDDFFPVSGMDNELPF